MLLQLQRNKQLDSFFVRNLNQDPQGWALEEKSVDSVLCCVSVQYLQQVSSVPPLQYHPPHVLSLMHCLRISFAWAMGCLAVSAVNAAEEGNSL